MKPYQEKLEGGYRLVRIRSLKRAIVLFLLVLTFVGWAFVWFSRGAGLKPFYAPVDAVLPWLLIMLLIYLTTAMAFRDIEIRYAKRDGQRYLMANNSQKRAIWTIIIAAAIMVAFALPQTSGFAASELTNTTTVRISSGQILSVAEFPNQDSLGLTKVDWFNLYFTNDNGSAVVSVFRDSKPFAPSKFLGRNEVHHLSSYNEGEAMRIFNITAWNGGPVPIDLQITRHIVLASTLTTLLPVIMAVFIGFNVAWYIWLNPIRKKYASASIYSIDYFQDLEKGEQVYSAYDMRAKGSSTSIAKDLPPPPETFLDFMPPPPEAKAEEPPAEAVAAGAAQHVSVQDVTAPGVPPKSFEMFVEDGSKSFASSDYESALRDFDSALNIEPSNITALLARGNALIKLGRDTEALASFEKIISTESTNEKALRNKAMILVGLKQWPSAIKALDAYLQVRPADVEALKMKGDALMEVGKRNDAALAYETALNLSPGDSDLRVKLEKARLDVASLLSRAMVSTASGSYDQALVFYDAILRFEPANARALAGKAGVLRRLGRKEEAIASLDAVLAIESENPGALLEKTKILLEDKRFAEALFSAERLVKVSPMDARGWVLRGDLLIEQGSYDEGRVSYEQGLKAEPGNLDIAMRIEALQGKIAEAAQGVLLRELDSVKGIGPAKVRSLYESGFKTVDDLRKASIDDLSNVKGISRKLAEDIAEHFKAGPASTPQP